jgi:hypothetical protein
MTNRIGHCERREEISYSTFKMRISFNSYGNFRETLFLGVAVPLL